MVEVRSKRCLGRTETDREISKRAVVVEVEEKRTMKTTLRSERKSLLKKYLTGPTLLEMSGNATSMIGRCQEGKSSPDALRRSAGVILFDSSPRVCGFSAAVPIRNRTRLPFADA